MPVYNAQAYVKQAVESILNQTYGDYELLIVNDCSTDASRAIVTSFADNRIRLIDNETNLGIARSRNRGLELASGDFIALMDSDDISLPDRLEKQVAFMERHQECGVCGSWILTIGRGGGHIMRYPSDCESIRCAMFFKNKGMANPAAMLRRRVFERLALRYDTDLNCFSDYDFWVRCLHTVQFANINEVLLHYRLHETNTENRIAAAEQKKTLTKIRRALLAHLGLYPDEQELEIHNALCGMRLYPDKTFIADAERWLLKIKAANDARGLYRNPLFSKMLGELWFGLCTRSGQLGWWAFKTFRRSPLARLADISFALELKFLMKCILRLKDKTA